MVGIRQAIWLLAAALCLGAAGCVTRSAPLPLPAPVPGAVDYFSEKHIALREGDIILLRGQGLLSDAIAHYGIPQGPYSHSGVYYRDSLNYGKILCMYGNGLNSYLPANFIGPGKPMALIRLKDKTAPARLGQEIRALCARNQNQPIKFDFKWAKNLDNQRELYCNELLSHLYLKCGLPDPFVQAAGVHDSDWAKWARTHTRIDLISSVSPNAALTAKHFVTLAQVAPPDAFRQQNIITSVIMKSIKTRLGEQHYELRRPSLGSRIIIVLERDFLRCDYLQNLSSPELRSIWLACAEYIRYCKKLTLRTLRRTGNLNAPDADVRRLTERVCDFARDKYFRKTTPAISRAKKVER